MRSFIVLTLVLGISGATLEVVAQAGENPEDAITHALARAIDKRLTVWESPAGHTVYVSHCRSTTFDCRERIGAFARLIAHASVAHGVDPFLVAAIDLRESGFDPLAEGSAGERGVVQLHPRGRGHDVRFVRSEAYLRRCARRPDACQGEIIETGVELLSEAIRRCGTVADGLGMYNSGVCQETGYSRRVLYERAQLIALAKSDQEPMIAALMD